MGNPSQRSQYGYSPGDFNVRRSSFFDLLPDDLRLHRSEHGQKVALLLLRHFELVERPLQIFDERVELRIGDIHALVRGRHVTARIGAGAARSLADLIDEILLEPRNIVAAEESVDPVVRGDVAD